jgi:hypothetical protein
MVIVGILAVLGWTTVAMALPSGVQALYKFENNLLDSSGNGFDLSPGAGSYGYGPNTAQTYPTQSLCLPSDIAQTDYLTGSHLIGGGTGEPGGGTEGNPGTRMDLSVSFWIKPVAVDGHDPLYYIAHKTDPINDVGWTLRVDSANGRMRYTWYDERERSWNSPNGSLTMGEWSHWVMVHDGQADGGNGDFYWYKNGVLQNFDTYTWDNLFNSGGPLLVGTRDDGSALTDFSGNLDCFGIWQRALDYNEATSIYPECLVPEPMTALLLLAGMPLLRRRR